jgi:hypothetical protein
MSLAVLPVPDSGIDNKDRVQVSGFYAGTPPNITRSLSGVAEGVLSLTANITLGQIESLSGVAEGVLLASLLTSIVIQLNGDASGEVSAGLRITLQNDHSGIITGY